MFDIVFVVPGPGNVPIGGHKVIYEYANRLTARKFKVAIVHAARSHKPINYRDFIRSYGSYTIRKLFGTYKPKWFDLDGKVELFWFHYMNVDLMPKGKAYVATAWDTAGIVKAIPGSSLKKMYLIQGYEDWVASSSELATTYNCGLHNLAVSKWIKRVVESTGAACEYLPNGIDSAEFYLENDPDSRPPYGICTFHHKQDFKGYEQTVKVLENVLRSYPELEVKIFGTIKQPSNIPVWASYYPLPNRQELRRLYNSSSIFISSSEKEGWGLTLCEAMQCGCAIVATNIDGHREFCINGRNSLLSEVGNIEEMAGNIKVLLENRILRSGITKSSVHTAGSLTWDRSIIRLIYLMGN